MALTRRSTNRVTASIWPGFVDAMTALLLVLMFLLTIFMVVQYVLREEISGQESELDVLSSEITDLSRLLGQSVVRARNLEAERDSLRDRTSDQATRIEDLRRDRDAQSVEAAELLTQRDDARAEIAGLEADRSDLLSDQEALNLALAAARDEIDAQTEAARLAAARREALEALTAELQAELDEDADANAALAAEIADLNASLSDEEAARLAEAAAAENLRSRLENADAELTAMSLALEEQRAEAEETLTLLAAANAASEDLDSRLAAALLAVELGEDRAQDLTRQIADTDAALEDALASRADLQSDRNETSSRLRAALAREGRQAEEMAAISDALTTAEAAKLIFQGDLDTARARLSDAEGNLARLREAAGREATERDRLAAALKSARDEMAALAAASGESEQSLRDQLAEALALRQAAEAEVDEQMTETERQNALLAQARGLLAEEASSVAENQRQMEALRQQVTVLQQELSGVRDLLDLAGETRAENLEEIADLETELADVGTKLNAALIREAEEQKRRAELEAAERERLELYRSEFFGRLRGLLSGREGVQIVGDRFVFDSEVLFPSGSATLSSAGQDQVRRVAELLDDVSSDIPENIDWVIRVDGHTDDVPVTPGGRFADNWELSQARALSVVRFMNDELGFPANRLAPTGFGEFRPVVQSSDPEARARNRRIELKLTER